MTDCHGYTPLVRARKGPPDPAQRCSEGELQRMVALLESATAAQRVEVGSGGRSRVGEAEARRKEGNAAFAAGRYQQAIDMYTRSIECHEDHRTFANRAACYLKLGLLRYRERRGAADGLQRREAPGLCHQICDGEAKIVRWVPDCDGSCSTPDDYNGRGDFPGGVYCDGCCSHADAVAFRCRSVEVVTTSIGDFYRQAVGDAARAKTLEPTFAKAHYRAARAQIGLWDFPRARLCLETGLQHCPGHREMTELLEKLLQMGVGERGKDVGFSNPLSDVPEREGRRGEDAMCEGSAIILCAYCTASIAHPTKKRVPSLGRAALAWRTAPSGLSLPTGKGRRTKEEALVRAGFPTTCYQCALNPCADVDQRAIHEMIEAP